MSKIPPENTQASEQQESASALVWRQAHFDAFFAAANAGMTIFDRQLRYVQINEALAEINGIPVADHIGRSVREVLPELAPAVEPMLQEILDTGKAILDFEVVGETPKQPGILRYWLASYYPLADDNGTIFGVGGTVIEITERKKAEEALKQSEERFRSLVQASAQIVWITNAQGELISEHSHQWTAFTGQTFEECQEQGWLTVIHPDDRSYLATAWSAAIGNCSLYEVEFRLRRYDGQYRYMACRSIPVLEADGTIREWVGSITDITERKEAEAKLQESEEQLRLTFEQAAIAISHVSLDGRWLLVNQRLCDILGYTREELMALTFQEITHADDLEIDLSYVHQLLRGEIPRYSMEKRYIHKNGSLIWINLDVALVRGISGEPNYFISTIQDISDRKATEDALKRNEERFRSLMEASAQIIWISNADGELIGEQPTWAAFTGQSFDEYDGWGWLDRGHPDDQAHVARAWSAAVASRSLYEVEYRVRRHDGEYRHMACRAVPILGADGTIREWVGANTDITERKQAEQKLRQTLEILDLASDSIIIRDMDDRIIYWNQGAEKLYGWTKEEVLGQYIHTFLQTVLPKPLETILPEFLQQGSWEGELQHTTREGQHVIVASRWTLQRDAEGKPFAQLEINNDITDRKQAEDALKQSEERYRSLILATSQIVWTADAEGRCPDIPSLRAYTGQTEAEVIGFGWLDAMHPDDQERTAQVWMEAVQTKSLYDIEYRIRGADGNYRYFQGRAVPILNEDGSIREWIGTCIDIHDRKQAEIAQAKAKEAAEAASRAKSEFLANMSHELRTPLNGIMGYAQILQRSKFLNPEERSRIDVIFQCGSHLLTLINDILDLSKIEAQKVELLPTDFHFPAFLQGVAEMCRIRAELKGIQFDYQSVPELPIGIRADEKRLRQVLINLLSNAIKFTDAGSVTFTVSFASEGKIRFQVRDTGIGVAQDKLQAIFQPFEQVGDSRRQTEGTGLGLAISQRIVELMDSTIEVQSEVGVGSIFWFDVNLPQADEWVKTSQADDRGQIIGVKNSQPKIVVIDDKWANRSVIANLLSPIGFEVFEGIDGQEGWQKILEVQPDLVITDLLMPKLDGFELIKRIRESEQFKDIIIIVSSASVFESDQHRSLEAGGNEFIPKPIQAADLLQKLQKSLHLEWIYETHETPLPTESESNELIAPPATEMEILYELAMKGNFREIVKQAALLEEINSKYIPFVKKLHQMARDFQDEEILAFIQSYK